MCCCSDDKHTRRTLSSIYNASWTCFDVKFAPFVIVALCTVLWQKHKCEVSAMIPTMRKKTHTQCEINKCEDAHTDNVLDNEIDLFFWFHERRRRDVRQCHLFIELNWMGQRLLFSLLSHFCIPTVSSSPSSSSSIECSVICFHFPSNEFYDVAVHLHYCCGIVIYFSYSWRFYLTSILHPFGANCSFILVVCGIAFDTS